ncbi:dTMP kinase [Streptomyces goshikiensis]|uniref:dTMP kinase n=1 Tax=Streptomyces goshikiensis TaxID=1942 RepID=UPI0037F7AE91
MKTPPIVAFIGLDGAGKSTQIDMLKAAYEARGHSVFVHPNPSLQGLSARLDQVAAENGYADRFAMLGPDTHKVMTAAVKWMAMSSLGTAPEGTDLVIADRYAYCQIAAADALGASNRWLIEGMFRGLPEPALTVMMDLNPALSVARVKARDPEEWIDHAFLTRMRAAYAALPQASDWAWVDADATAEAVHTDIVAVVDTKLGELL